MHHILVAGGDRRNVFLAEIFKKDGHKVSVCGFNEETFFSEGIERISDIKKAASLCDVIVLPLPLSFDGITLNAPYGNECIYIDDILASVKKDCIATGGRVGNEIFEKYGVAPSSLYIQEMDNRWGSCTPKGKIILNTQLIRAPRPCIEYVITHELCHLLHPDHTKAFWELLQKEMPDWERWKNKLERFML